MPNKKPPTISIVTMLKDRTGARVKRFLDSLAEQTTPPDDIIIIDESEGLETIRQNIDICSNYANVRYISIPMKKFNMPLAFNIGIRESGCKYLGTVTIDEIFCPHFIETVLHKLSKRGRLVLAEIGYLPPDADFENLGFRELCYIVDKNMIGPRWSPGTIQAARRDFFVQIRGYDEEFTGLGGIDDDLIDRARRFGLTPEWIPFNKAPVLHQWHPISKMKGESSHLFLKSQTIVRNDPEHWGRRP